MRTMKPVDNQDDGTRARTRDGDGKWAALDDGGHDTVSSVRTGWIEGS